MTGNVTDECRVLYDLMRRFWDGFGLQMEAMLSESGVNVPQYLAMVALSKSGESTMGRLARDLHVTMGAATNIADKLIRGGYATRERGTDDRRIVRVKLLPKGEETLKAVDEEAAGFMTRVLGELAGERRREFLEAFERMVQAAESLRTAGVAER